MREHPDQRREPARVKVENAFFLNLRKVYVKHK